MITRGPLRRDPSRPPRSESDTEGPLDKRWAKMRVIMFRCCSSGET